MARLPSIQRKHRICVICEGDEDFYYFKKLTNIAVWNDVYEFCMFNAKSASNIPAMYMDKYQNNHYEAVLIFCDTDKTPYREYTLIKKKIREFHGDKNAAPGRIIIFANPCTMQIVLSHFGDVRLTNQGKKTNADVIEALTGVKNYDAHTDQIEEICKQVLHRNYPDMRGRVSGMNEPDTVSGSTNFFPFLKIFESDDIKWIGKLSKYLVEGE